MKFRTKPAISSQSALATDPSDSHKTQRRSARRYQGNRGAIPGRALLMTFLCGVVLSSAGVMLSGCGGGDSPESSPTEAGAPPAASPTGKEEELEGKLVSSFPNFAPLHPGEITKSKAVKRTTDGALKWTVKVQTDAPFDEVKNAIATSYSENGWEIVSAKENNMGAMSSELLMARGHGMTISIVYTKLDDIVQIAYGLN